MNPYGAPVTSPTSCARCASPLRPWGSARKSLGRAHGTRDLCRSCTPKRPVRGDRRFSLQGRDAADFVVVDRVCGGDTLPTNLAERRAIVQHLTMAGESAAQIARRLRCSQRTVVRIRALAT